MMIAFEAGQQNVRFGNCADARMQYPNLDLVGAEFHQHFAERFLRSLDVAFQNQRHFLDFALCQLLVKLIQRQA